MTPTRRLPDPPASGTLRVVGRDVILAVLQAQGAKVEQSTQGTNVVPPTVLRTVDLTLRGVVLGSPDFEVDWPTLDDDLASPGERTIGRERVTMTVDVVRVTSVEVAPSDG